MIFGFQFPDNPPDPTCGVETGRIMLQYTTAKEFKWALSTLVLFLSVAVNFGHTILKQIWASCSKNSLLGRGSTFSSCCSMTKLTRSFRLRFYTRRTLHLEHKVTILLRECKKSPMTMATLIAPVRVITCLYDIQYRKQPSFMNTSK